MNCQRCNGFMISELMVDQQNGQTLDLDKCLNCGHRTDDVCVSNRETRPVLKQGGRKYDGRTKTWSSPITMHPKGES